MPVLFFALTMTSLCNPWEDTVLEREVLPTQALKGA